MDEQRMDVIESTLAPIDGGRVLDVATQRGRFAKVMMDNLRSYSEIVGIDVSERAVKAAGEAMDEKDVRFLVMDAEMLEFEDETFDTVSISTSLHHMSDLRRALEEMKRVLKPGGRFIVLEMHNDLTTEAERTSALLHGWAAEIDVLLGRSHNPTLTRQEILDEVARLGLRDVRVEDCVDSDSAPMEEEKLAALEKVIGMVSARAVELDEPGELLGRGDVLLRRVHDVGAVGEPLVLVTGEK